MTYFFPKSNNHSKSGLINLLFDKFFVTMLFKPDPDDLYSKGQYHCIFLYF